MPKRITLSLGLLVLLLFAFTHAQQASNDLTVATLPTSRLNEPWWAERHNTIVDYVRKHPDIQLLFMGASIIQNFEKSNPPDQDFLPIWKQFYEPRRALNLGFSGDTTANLLWRLNHGEIDHLSPRVAIVMIGNNNTGHAHQTAEQTEAGIDTVIATLSQRLPQTRLLILGILPTGFSPEKSAADQAVNSYLAKRFPPRTGKPDASGKNTVADGDPRVTFLDIGSTFKDASGAINTSLFYDPRQPHPSPALHPDTRGQRMMAEAIEPTLAKLMYDKPRTTAPTATVAPATATPQPDRHP